MPGLSFVTMFAYDYRYAFNSIPSYYDLADEIIIGMDQDRLTWMKQPFQMDMDEVRAFIEKIDVQKKIRIIEGNFHTEEHPLVNDNLERSALSRACIEGNWVVMIDADEIVLNGPEFKAWLLANNPAQYNVYGRWISVFKTFGDQVLVVDPPGETVPIATMVRGEYTGARLTKQQGILSPLQLLHFSWGRTPQELAQKISNWGHAGDFHLPAFFQMWQSVTLQNYHQLKNFHPLNGPVWQSLKLATIRRQ